MSEFKVPRLPQEPPSAVLERRRRAAIDDLVTTWDCAPMMSTSDGPTEDDYLSEFLTENADPLDRVFKTRIEALVGLSKLNASTIGVDLLERIADPNERWFLCDEWVKELMADPERKTSARIIADIIIHSLPDKLPYSEVQNRAFTSEEVHLELFLMLAFVGDDLDKERLVRACETALDRLDNNFLRNQILRAWDLTDYLPFRDAVQSYAEEQEDDLQRFDILCELAHYAGSIQEIRAAVLMGIRLLQRPQKISPSSLEKKIIKVLHACGRRVRRAGHVRHLIPEPEYDALYAALDSHPRYQAALDNALLVADTFKRIDEK